MSTYTQILYQIVFSTRNREQTLTKGKRDELFKYMSGIIFNKKCHLYRINGVEDHLHILTHLHPSVSLSDLVKDIKVASAEHIKKSELFLNFRGWQNGYGAFTYSTKEKDVLIEYIKNQEEHHRNLSFKEEFIQLLNEHQVEFDEKYLL
jgi:REP element-mobilizing transposase RayT